MAGCSPHVLIDERDAVVVIAWPDTFLSRSLFSSVYLFVSLCLTLFPRLSLSRNPDEVIRLIGTKWKEGRGGVDKND